MTQELTLQDFVIILVSKKHKSTHLNLDVAKGAGIIPTDWQPARPPIYTNDVSQLIFTNRISIIAQLGRIIFVQPMEGKNATSLLIPEIARRYAQMMSNLEFDSVLINPRGFVRLAGEQENARKYITDNLLAPGAWHEFEEASLRASLNLVYQFNQRPLYLTINEASLRQEDESSVPIILFDGNFSYELTGENATDKIHNLSQVLDNCQADIETYTNLISTKFFPQSNNSNSISNVFAMSASV